MFRMRGPPPPPSRKSPPRPKPQTQAQAKLQLPPPPLSETQGPTSPPITVAQAAPAPAPEVAPKTAHAGKAPVGPAGVGARERAQFRLKLARLGGVETKPPIRLGVPAMPMAQPASCERDAGSDDCRTAVIQADSHLRSVYQGAIRRGVSPDVMVEYCNRWADLRERDTDDPTRLIENYGALAYDLGRENTGAQARAPRVGSARSGGPAPATAARRTC